LDEKSAFVVVPDSQLSLAIGKKGQNARLAAKLTGYKIDIKSHSKAEEMGYFDNLDEDDEYSGDYEEDSEDEDGFFKNVSSDEKDDSDDNPGGIFADNIDDADEEN
jgi:N utilization substance protein A